MKEPVSVPHPGIRVKAEVIPKGMPVTKAAELLGVGRPALSNFLNGNAALSADMATRLAKAFNYPRKDLLEMQARYDAAQANTKSAPAGIKAYVPPFLGIKSNQIEQWATNNIAARTRLSVFLRTLVHSTNQCLSKVDFPGNDEAERPGWDGFVEATEGTPWVPVGRSGWEFGTNENINKKAKDDFNKNVKALAQNERAEITFVFVSPRRWSRKAAWVEEAMAKGHWKSVRAYDASDLEQWLEQSLPAQAWFASETNIPAQDVRSLDTCWIDWANVSDPPLTGALFVSAIEAFQRKMLSYLSKPSDGPIVIAADSTEEALAFLAQLLGQRGGEDLAAYRDRVLVFDKPGVLSRLAQCAQTFIPVAFTREVERELGPYAKSMHSIVVYPRNAVNTEPHIVLEPVNYETFNKALEEMGKDRDEIRRLTNESGRSLTVLRRRVATVPAVQTPEWAADHKIAVNLVPFLFVGAWNSGNDADKSGLESLAGRRPYVDLERDFQNVLQLNDAPVWSIDAHRGIISKIDLLYAIAGLVTGNDLKQYYSIARKVLGEDDPSLDLEPDQRWAALIYGKKREYSSVFRKGISETLVLLAVHGNKLFKNRLGIDTEEEARRIVHDLLPTPLTTRILEANDSDLPTYAEAAPDEFLTILEQDLKADAPAARGLLKPMESGVFSHPSRTGLLWALEGLSWNPETLPRAAFILARLAQVEINDNWGNKPVSSLGAIFRSRMPQTAASYEERVDLMRKLAKHFPNIAWKICVEQFSAFRGFGHYSHKPRWRSDGFGFGEPLRDGKLIHDFQREMVEMALSWKEYTLDTLTDLVERLSALDDSYQARVWTLIEMWARDKASDADKSALREKIRVSTLSRRTALRSKANTRWPVRASKARAVYAALEPSDLLNRHAWLFRDNWVDESADEIEEIETSDFEKRAERIQKMRVDAMREILDQRGFAGLLEMAERGGASWQIGALAANDLLSEKELNEFVSLAFQSVLADKNGVCPLKSLISGALRTISDGDKRERALKAIASGLSEEDMARLLLHAPFDKSTWSLVDALDETAQGKYWIEVAPDWFYHTDEENNEGIARLLKAGRPFAAFSFFRHHSKKMDTLILFRLLSEMAKGGNDRPGEYLPEHYHIEKAFKQLNDSPELTLDQKASLEFEFNDVLVGPGGNFGSGYGIPNLERYFEIHPELFVRIVAWAYKRDDNGEDPAELQIPLDQVQMVSERSSNILEAFKRIPGHNDLGELTSDHLSEWIEAVRRSCAGLSRTNIADYCLGKLLGHAPVGSDGVWPCEPVRQVMEDIQSVPMVEGAYTSVLNSLGVIMRGEGGGLERGLADKYRKWGQALQFSHPFVSSKLLMKLAKTYEYEAGREDSQAMIRRRLG